MHRNYQPLQHSILPTLTHKTLVFKQLLTYQNGEPVQTNNSIIACR